MKKVGDPFLQLNEREVIVAILLFFSTCFLLFFSGYLWGRYAHAKNTGKDFAQEVRHALHIYANNENIDNLEDFDAADEQDIELGVEEKESELSELDARGM